MTDATAASGGTNATATSTRKRDGTASRPFHVLVKPSGAICNLACDYCYFLAKEELYPGSDFRMSDEVRGAYVRRIIDAQPGPDVSFAWQGGEPTLMGVDFFARAVELQHRYRRPGQRVHNAIQTNGTRLDDAWCRFLKRHDFLVGVSLDGPEELHDRYRRDRGGAGTFHRVLRGIELLRTHGVPFNILTTVHAGNQDHPLSVYRFLRDEIGAEHIQFIPIVERADPRGFQEGRELTDRTVDPGAFGAFLYAVFGEWIHRDVGRVFVQLFEVTLGKYLGRGGGLCVFEETCGTGLALEHTGDVYACDHYVQPDHLLGNLVELPMADLVDSDVQRRFGDAKRDTLPAVCRECEVRWLCHGGCPKDRVVATGEEGRDLNHLCRGYYAFFTNSRAGLQLLADRIASGLPAIPLPADGGSDGGASRPQQRRPTGPKAVPRNAPCPCGSGRKYKHCCGGGRTRRS